MDSDDPRSDDPDSLPPGFWKWPREHRIAFYDSVLTRSDVVAHVRSFIGSGTDLGPAAGAGDRLTTEELCYVAADLGALPREHRRGEE
jgi:hypothetical protein